MALNLFKKKKDGGDKKTDIAEISQPNTNNQTPTTNLADVSLVVKGAHVTEKAGSLNKLNQYAFKVASGANKIEIKKAVEKMYGVKVERVTTSVVPAKKRKFGRQEGEKAGFKKAIVKLVEGSKIHIMPK